QTWYTSTSGLLGSVVAELAPDPRFAALVVLPDLERSMATVTWRLEGAGAPVRGIMDVTVTSPRGTTVAHGSADCEIGAATLSVPDPEVWDVGQPALYRLDAVMREGLGDEASVRFGMRSVAVKAGEIVLNGRPIYLR